MAVWFMEGHEGGDQSTKWSAITGTWTVGSSYGRNGNGVLHPVPTASAQLSKTCDAADESATFIAGFAFRTSQITTTDGYADVFLCQFRGDANATQHVTFTLVSDGSIRARRGAGNGTILGTSTTGAVAAIDTWYYLEFKVNLHDTTGTVDVRVNGSSVLSLTSQDTKNGGTDAVFDSIALGRSGFGNWHSDDLYLANNLGSVNDDFLGDSTVEMRFPDADDTVEWTTSTGSSHFALVDEATPDTADYVESSTVDQKDMFTLQDVSNPAYTIHAVQLSAYAAKNDSPTRSFRFRTESVAATDTSSDIALATTYATRTHVVDLNPNGSAVWTPAAVDAAKFGVQAR